VGKGGGQDLRGFRKEIFKVFDSRKRLAFHQGVSSAAVLKTNLKIGGEGETRKRIMVGCSALEGKKKKPCRVCRWEGVISECSPSICKDFLQRLFRRGTLYIRGKKEERFFTTPRGVGLLLWAKKTRRNGKEGK